MKMLEAGVVVAAVALVAGCYKETLRDWGNAKQSLEFWADASVYRFCVLRVRTHCGKPKNSPLPIPAPSL